MTPLQTRKRFSTIVAKEGKEVVAAKIGCSVTHVLYISEGKREIGLRLAVAVQEVYGLPAVDWVERPAAPNIG